jgi:cytochrome c oxidase cbb3-type subunit II
MMNFRTFILGLTASFGLPWLCLIVLPAMNYQQLAPLAYDKERDGVDLAVYPPAPVNGQGQLIYIQEGCNQCHTQMIRPAQLGLDAWYKGWGSDQEALPAPARPSDMRDYLGEKFALLGVQRIGPDLANYGYRAASTAKLHQMLYAPKAIHDWSTMPSYAHLYKVQKIQGPASQRAVKLPSKFAPEPGYEVIPTAEADRLVEYLLSLKKDYPIPGKVAAAAPAAAVKK